MSRVLRLPRENHFCGSSSNVPRLPPFLDILHYLHVLDTLAACTIPCACHPKRHLNVKRWSEHVMFWTFWFGNMLRATTPCTFSASQLPTRRRLARERKRWCYSSRKYDDHKIADEIFQCNFKMRKTERKKSKRETYSEREKRSADMWWCRSADVRWCRSADVRWCRSECQKKLDTQMPRISLRWHFYPNFSMKMSKTTRYPNVMN